MKTRREIEREKDKNKKKKETLDEYDIDNLEDIPKKLRNGDKISRALALPEGTFKNFPTIEIRGNREIMIDGCTGLLSYGAENILLETRYCRIKIIGRALTLNNFTRNVLAVRGFIQNVEFNM